MDRSSEHDFEDEDDQGTKTLETHGEWEKRALKIPPKEIPSIDRAYLSMDASTGMETVWHEVNLGTISEVTKKRIHGITKMFENLCNMDHPNIVNFKDYWIDYKIKEGDDEGNWEVLTEQHSDDEQEEPDEQGAQSLEGLIDELRNRDKNIRVRLVFITEYMNTGTLHDNINKNHQSTQSLNPNTFQRWCNQLLSAVGYLHDCEPPIFHGNLENKCIFQHRNGALKIGAIVRHYVKQKIHDKNDETEDIELCKKNDIRDFGIIALGMLQPEYGKLNEEKKKEARVWKPYLNQVNNSTYRKFLKRCLNKKAEDRPGAQVLLRDPALYGLKSLKLIAAHQYLDNVNVDGDENSNYDRLSDPMKDFVIAEYCKIENGDSLKFRWGDLLKNRKNNNKDEATQSRLQDLNLHKFLEDVRNGQHGMGTTIKPPTATLNLEKNEPAVEPPEGDSLSQINGANSNMTSSVHGDIQAQNGNPQNNNGALSDGKEQDQPENNADPPVEIQPPKSKYDPEVRMIKKCEIEIRKNNIPQQAESVSSQASDTVINENSPNNSPFTIEIKLTFLNRAERILNADITREDKGLKIAKELVEYGFISPQDMTEVSTVFNNAWQKAFGAQDLPQQHYLQEQILQEKMDKELTLHQIQQQV